MGLPRGRILLWVSCQQWVRSRFVPSKILARSNFYDVLFYLCGDFSLKWDGFGVIDLVNYVWNMGHLVHDCWSLSWTSKRLPRIMWFKLVFIHIFPFILCFVCPQSYLNLKFVIWWLWIWLASQFILLDDFYLFHCLPSMTSSCCSFTSILHEPTGPYLLIYDIFC